jgi:hypothetical protein
VVTAETSMFDFQVVDVVTAQTSIFDLQVIYVVTAQTSIFDLQVVDSYHLRLPLGLIFPFRVVICHNTLN